MTTPRRLRRPQPKREHQALTLAAQMRRAGFKVEPWQVDALRRMLDKYVSLEAFQAEVVKHRKQIENEWRYGLYAMQLRFGGVA